MYKIFINDKPLFLVSDSAAYRANETNLLVNFHSGDDLKYGILALEEQERIESVMIFHDDLQHMWEVFQAQFRIIEAAGGLVKNTEDNHLLIFRNGKWDLPKGKLEKSETRREAALREVEEECGISNMTIVSELPNTYHTYQLNGTEVLKISYWYSMSYSGNESPVPQNNEGIEKALWLDADEIRKSLTNSYSSVREMLESLI